jgi:hypothetical protein
LNDAAQQGWYGQTQNSSGARNTVWVFLGIATFAVTAAVGCSAVGFNPVVFGGRTSGLLASQAYADVAASRIASDILAKRTTLQALRQALAAGRGFPNANPAALAQVEEMIVGVQAEVGQLLQQLMMFL